MRILLVEDEVDVAASFCKGLEEQGYLVDVFHNGLAAQAAFKTNYYSLALVDVLLPGLSGISLCRVIRRTEIRIPIILLTALDSIEDKVLGFEAGADDYLSKPFDFLELLARIRSLIRRTHILQLVRENILKISDLSINLDSHEVRRGEEVIDLTNKEYALLECLIRNRGKVLSRAQLAEKVWTTPFDSNSNIIDVYISFLRKKIDKGRDTKLLYTISGVGYVIREAAIE